MSQEAVLWSIRLLFALLALIVVAVFVVRPVLRMLRSKPDLDLLMPDYAKGSEEEEELQIPAGMDGPPMERAEIIKTAQDDPQQTAMLVQQWLKERK